MATFLKDYISRNIGWSVSIRYHIQNKTNQFHLYQNYLVGIFRKAYEYTKIIWGIQLRSSVSSLVYIMACRIFCTKLLPKSVPTCKLLNTQEQISLKWYLLSTEKSDFKILSARYQPFYLDHIELIEIYGFRFVHYFDKSVVTKLIHFAKVIRKLIFYNVNVYLLLKFQIFVPVYQINQYIGIGLDYGSAPKGHYSSKWYHYTATHICVTVVSRPQWAKHSFIFESSWLRTVYMPSWLQMPWPQWSEVRLAYDLLKTMNYIDFTQLSIPIAKTHWQVYATLTDLATIQLYNSVLNRYSFDKHMINLHGIMSRMIKLNRCFSQMQRPSK